MRCSFVPAYVLEQLANAAELGRTVDSDVVVASRETLVIDAAFRQRRQAHPRRRVDETGTGGWVVHTADHGTSLPGTPVRSQDEPAAGDEAVDEAWVGIEAVLAMFREVYGRGVLRRRRRARHRDRALRAGLRQRLLGRDPARLRRR